MSDPAPETIFLAQRRPLLRLAQAWLRGANDQTLGLVRDYRRFFVASLLGMLGFRRLGKRKAFSTSGKLLTGRIELPNQSFKLDETARFIAVCPWYEEEGRERPIDYEGAVWVKGSDMGFVELDLDTTIRETANHGYLDVHMRPERRNAVKVLVFFDIGGSMDSHIEQVEELFSAAKTEFKHMEYFYFHNCLYEGVWKQNKRRFTDRTPTWDILHKYPHDYKVVFVGDASMSPYEIMVPGGSVEHVNEEAGSVWLDRVIRTYPHAVWLNPVAQRHWDYSESTTIIRRLFANRMYPITIEGLENAMRELVR